jgi:hypothetical protein
LCAHGATCGWMRLKWLADVAALLDQSSDTELRELYRFGRSLGAKRCVGQAMLLCRRLFGTTLPYEVLSDIRRDPVTGWLERIALASLIGGGGAAELDCRPTTARAVLFSRFLLSRDWRYRYDIARERWISIADREQVRMPRKLAFLYHFLRIPLFIRRSLRTRVRRQK